MASAEELARCYDRYVSALWRGETEDVRQFAAWLKAFWQLGEPEPAGPPAAVSTLGGAGTSIRWHQTPGMILGYIPGVPLRCYQVPTDAEPPALAPYASADTVASAAQQ